MENVGENKFYLIISILIFIFMVLGATFAYYTSTVKSNDVMEVTSANVTLNLSITPLYNEKSIIPANDTDIMTAFNNSCVDALGNGACYAYNVKVENLGDSQEVIGTFNLTSETIKNLKYLILDADNDNEIYKDISNASNNDEQIGDSFNLDTGESKNLILVIWLSNLTEAQDYDASGVFNGSFTVTSALGTEITGTMSVMN